MKKLFVELSSPKYKNLSGLITILGIGIAGLMLLLKDTLVANTVITQYSFSNLLRTILFFILGIAGFVIMVRAELRQGFSIIKGNFARVTGLIMWLVSWWIAFGTWGM